MPPGSAVCSVAPLELFRLPVRTHGWRRGLPSTAAPQLKNQAAAIERGEAKPSRKFEIKTANDLIRVRNKLGVSQARFARLLGISEDTLQNWEQGRRNPSSA